MTEQHPTFRQFEDYAARRLPAQEIAAFHEHVENCAECRELLAATTSAGVDHITGQQAVDYAAGRLSSAERSAAARHIETCDSCRAMVDDLAAFRQTLPSPRPIRTWILPLAAALVLAAGISAWLTAGSHSGPAVIAELRDSSGAWQLTGSNVLRHAASLPSLPNDSIDRVLRTGHLPAGPEDMPATPRETLRAAGADSAAAPIRIVSPDGIRVLSDRPEFHWEVSGPGATQQLPVEIQIFDENFNEVARSGPVQGSVWRPESPLPRSKPLLWQVTQVRNHVRITAPASPEPPARFEIVTEDAARLVAEARAMQPPSHLLLAIVYSEAGLRQEAASEVDVLSKLNPGSALAASLRKR